MICACATIISHIEFSICQSTCVGSKDPFGGSGVLLKVEGICNFGGGLWGPTKGMTTIWGHIVIYVLFGTVIFDK